MVRGLKSHWRHCKILIIYHNNNTHKKFDKEYTQKYIWQEVGKTNVWHSCGIIYLFGILPLNPSERYMTRDCVILSGTPMHYEWNGKAWCIVPYMKKTYFREMPGLRVILHTKLRLLQCGLRDDWAPIAVGPPPGTVPGFHRQMYKRSTQHKIFSKKPQPRIRHISCFPTLR